MNATFKNKTILVVAPHPDDEVLGAGGLIKRVKDEGGKVFVLYLTVGSTTDFTKKGLSTEAERLAEIEGVSKFYKLDGWRIAFQGDLYHLQLDRLPLRQIIHEIERGEEVSLEALRADVIVFPSLGDYNQDHAVAARACFAACRPAPKKDKFTPETILSYEEPMDTWSMEPVQLNYFVELSERQLNAKIKAMEIYQSQIRGKGHPRSREVLKALAAVRGSSIGAEFAEGFFAHKISL